MKFICLYPTGRFLGVNLVYDIFQKTRFNILGRDPCQNIYICTAKQAKNSSLFEREKIWKCRMERNKRIKNNVYRDLTVNTDTHSQQNPQEWVSNTLALKLLLEHTADRVNIWPSSGAIDREPHAQPADGEEVRTQWKPTHAHSVYLFLSLARSHTRAMRHANKPPL